MKFPSLHICFDDADELSTRAVCHLDKPEPGVEPRADVILFVVRDADRLKVQVDLKQRLDSSGNGMGPLPAAGMAPIIQRNVKPP